MSTSKLYVRQMSSLDNGIAVYDPHPGYSGNEPNPRVQPGDVGYFTREGSFLRIFNIHSNEPGDESIPSDLTLYDLNPKYCRGSPFSARTISSSKRLSVFGKGKAVTPLPVGAGFSLDYERNQESVLHYFEPGWRENSIMRGNYERYIISDGDSWLRTARQYDPLLRAENIVLVTGCDLVRTWVIKVVDKKRIEGDVSLHVDVGLESGVEASYGVSWEESHGAIIHAGPAEIFNRSVLEDAAASSPHASKSKRRIRRVGNNISPARTESAPPSKAASAEKIKEWSDQCIFIRGYRLKKRLRSGIAPIELKAAAGPADLPPRDNGSGEGAGLLRADDIDANLDNSEDRMADADHMHQVLDYILDNSDADLAIAHEEDLTSWARHAGVVVDSDNGWYLTAEYVLQNHPPPVNTKTYGGITVGVILADGGEMMRTGLEQASAVSGKLSIRHPRSSRNSLRRMGEKITRPVSSYLKAVKMTLGRSLKGPYVPPPSSDTSLLFLNQGSGSVELIGHTHYVNSVAFSPDGRCVVSGSDDHTIRVWDTVTGKAALPPLIGHTDGVRSIAFSSDGRRIISGSLDRTIRIWDTVTGKETLSPLQGHTGWVTSISVSPDGARIASGGFDCTIRIWDAVTGMETLSPLQGHTSWVTSVSFSPDSTRIVSGSFDRTVRIWDAATGDIVAGPVEGHQDTVTSAAFSPDGTKVVSGSHDGTICVWDALLSTVSRPINAFRGEAPTSVAYSPDGAYIISSIDDGTIRRWDARTSELLSILSPTKTRTSPVLSISISPDGAYIASGSDDHAVRIWRTGDPSGIEAADKAGSIQTSKRADTSISADPSSSKPDSSSASKSPFQIQESLNAVLDAQSTSESGGQWLGDRKRPESFTQANQEPQQSPTPV